MSALAEQDRAAQAQGIKEDVHHEITEVFERYKDALHHTKGFVLSSKHIDLMEWKTFVRESHIENIHPGVWGFGYVQHVETDEVEALLSEMGSYGVDAFEIFPEIDPGSDSNDPLYVVKYEEPESRNRKVWGLNAAANPVNKSVYDAATDSGEHRLSMPFTLFQAAHSTHYGAVMVAPHFDLSKPLETVEQRRAAILGWLAVVIDFTYFFEHEALASWDLADMTLRLEGPDGELIVVYEDRKNTSFKQQGAGQVADAQSVETRLFSINLLGSELLLELRVDTSQLGSKHDAYANITLSVGAALTFLLTLIASLVSRSQRIAYKLASKMTARLRESELEQRELADAALAASNAKSMFLANMSHEIRTPMTAIIGYSEIIEESLREIDAPEDLSVPVRRIRSSGDHLLMLISDILDLSKIESGRFDIHEEESGIALVIEQSIATLQGSADAKGIGLSVHYEVPERVVIDSYRLKQVLINLIGNAVKFTSFGSVTLRCAVVEDTLEFRVKDTGIGIEREKLEEIFAPFSQADESMRRRHQGTGLGLAISRALAQHMGGDLTAKSEFGIGSEFILRLPLKSVEGYERMLTESSENAPEPEFIERRKPVTRTLFGRVLVAEDGPDNQKLINHHLTNAGLRVEIVENGAEALKLIRQGEHFDIVVMDMQMPIMDGYEATREIRKLGLRIPILALTAHAMAHDRDKCLEAGCDAYETKPINKQKLIEAIRTLIDDERSRGNAA